ncbi:DegT/DnrJ/EryC1/StrS family aminotransferase [Phenylobacterium sp.]|uniref:DegT/DnrJ/EryC1/StrS family aminotransferase n=1 Tax=Phenylobacterium sp. TaxID=1871053 RepID=UPI002ED8F5A9
MEPGIRLYIPDLPDADELVPFWRRIDAARWYTNFGPLEQAFAMAAATLLDAERPPGVATASSGTAALALALQALELPAGSRVLAPALTFPATAAAILAAGLEPLLADVDPNTWTLTPDIARRWTASVSAVVPVATFGVALPATAWDSFAEETGLPVVLDAAGALGRQKAPRRCVAVFSLHATKTLGVGEGGLVAAHHADLVARVRQLSNFGFEDGVAAVAAGNGKLSEWHAAVGLAQIPRAETLWGAKDRLCGAYRRALPGVPMQAETPGNLVVRLPISAERVARQLAAEGIETRRWYQPDLTRHPAYEQLPRAGELSATASLHDHLLGLPFHSRLTDDEVSTVARALIAAVARPASEEDRRWASVSP